MSILADPSLPVCHALLCEYRDGRRNGPILARRFSVVGTEFESVT